MRYALELRNLPLDRLGEYLVMAGGTLDGPRRATGPGWSATLIAQEPVRLGVITIPWDLLVIEGDDDAEVARVHAFMRRQTMRGGG
jgi:hypothetical protein